MSPAIARKPLHHFPRWCRQLAKRVVVLLPVKAFATLSFMAVFFAAYFAVLKLVPSTPIQMPLTPLDSWVPFSPSAFLIYASLWIYVSIPPALIRSLRGLLTFGAWIGAMCLFCIAIFWIFPTAVPPADIDWAAHPELLVLHGIDASGNAFPSLHVASSVFSAVWLAYILRRIRCPAPIRWLNGVHCLAIIWSTVALRQHVVLDIVGGIVVGTLFVWASFRHMLPTLGHKQI